jgi:hypothetical protein
MKFVRSDAVEPICTALDHPVIDSDAHLIEYYPTVREFLRG